MTRRTGSVVIHDAMVARDVHSEALARLELDSPTIPLLQDSMQVGPVEGSATSHDAGSKKRRIFTPSQGSAGSSAAAQAHAASNRKRPTSGISKKRQTVFQIELDRDLLGYRNKQGGVQLTARCQLCVAPLAQYCMQCTDQLLQGRLQPPGGALPQDSQLTAQRRSQSLHTVSVSSVRADTIKSVHSITQQNMSRIDSANHTLKQGGETQQLKQQTHTGTNRDSQRDTSSTCGTLEVDSEETNSLTSCVKAGGVKREDYDNTDSSVYSSGDGRERSHASALNARRNGIKLEPLDSEVTDDSLMADVAGSGSDSCETSAPPAESARRENSEQASRSSASDNSHTAARGSNVLPAGHESISVGSANQRSEDEALTLGDSSVSDNSSVLSSVSAIALAQAHSDSAEPGRFACELCPRTFDTIPQLRFHSKLHRVTTPGSVARHSIDGLECRAVRHYLSLIPSARASSHKPRQDCKVCYVKLQKAEASRWDLR
ncbi:hypothetical protein BaRGS_00028251 [Batillaria attramentaria]|uniref:C2H2-type domain-containing protein n=1 Tax=Batillaria attramentaria TaxID=370345 RepID=A0ABD0JZP2_9CAEN